MKKTILLIASVLVNVVLVYVFVFKGDTVVLNDARIELKMSSENKDFVMQEMRSFLESVQEINEGILNNDPSLIIDAGNESGEKVVQQTPKGLIKSLPIGFKQLGFSTHSIFDEISADAQKHFNAKETQNKLNDLLNNCVACHRTYKISTYKKD